MMFDFNRQEYAEGERAFARGLSLNLIIEQAQRDHAAILASGSETASADAESATAGLVLGYVGAALQCLYRVEGLLANLKLPAAPESDGS